MTDNRRIQLSQDAAIVVALAGTALPFAHSAEDEAERWLRALRLHGQVGAALQGLGVGEAPLMTAARPPGETTAGTRPFGPGIVDQVAVHAKGFAAGRGARTVATLDLLFALFQVYGRLLDRALYLRGSSREELLERMASFAERPVDSR